MKCTTTTVLVALVMALAAACGDSTSGNSIGADGSGDAYDGPQAAPHCGGSARSLAGVVTAGGQELTLPTAGLIADGQVAGVWDCPGTSTWIEFETGATLLIDVNTTKDLETAWKNLAASDPDVYSVGEIQGFPASFIDPAADPTGVAEGGVEFVLHGVDISVGGDGRIPLSNLTEAANQIPASMK